MTRITTEPRLDLHLRDKVISKRYRLFKAQEGRAQLELSLVFRSEQPEDRSIVQLGSPVKISSLSELRQIEEVQYLGRLF
ncbi:uncharacterized protein ACLA_072830 [Aspergillus clavatus NRRL 1]|uniref:Uncharacterized protein n=1 Tax=Aspergillus clavatus (strain ATCC 1007 / CBS 513.65 / DSM 816 / NCTC 3887 / NRRL 1 / QM 1276 / 107) TaxID=344612 RepID=A1C779_ASPCL|nr:uncharacterized protein ACLA_072830 [Aspergillus clavatus NRRL 1]EAW14250.1 hypothetical protein ACLA_072830 [Aspergillus clavatus NRRL 1]